MAKYRPDIKPPMWGPPEAVQYAVRANAELMGLPVPTMLLPHFEGSGTTLDLMTSGFGTDSGAPVWNHNRSIGVGKSYLNSADLTAFTRTPFSQTSGFTVLLIADVNDAIATNRKRAFRAIGSGGGTVAAIEFSDGASSGNVITPALVKTDGSFDQYLGGPAYSADKKYCIIQSWSAGTAQKLFVNGAIYKSSVTIASLRDSVSVVNIGNNTAGATFPLRGAVGHIIVFDRQINDTISAELTAYTPYALLMPVSRPVYFDLGATGNTDSSADQGNIAISGSAATGVKASISSADSGTVAIAGSVASGIRSLVSLATAASIAIAGFSAEGVYTPTGSTVSSAGPGAVAISGSPANGVQTHISSADPGTVVILGSDANAATGYATTAEPGTVAITGADATASRTYVATAGPTSIAISGSPAFATKSGGSSTSSGISLIFGKVILHL